MRRLNKLEWSVLENLSDDWECPATICPKIAIEIPDISRENILKTIYSLFSEKFIQCKNSYPVKLDELLLEIEDNFDTEFWFGLTEKGCTAWEKQSLEFVSEPITWINAWTGSENFQEKTGYVDGVNKPACLEGLKFMYPEGWEEIIKRYLINEMPIDGFYAKYYKYISEGYRIKYIINK